MAEERAKQSGIRRTAGRTRRYRVMMRLTPVAVGVLILITLFLYVAAALYDRRGSFTVRVDQYDSFRYALTLSETADFAQGSVRLHAGAAERVTNISGADLPVWLDNVDGSHNGKNYMAYTFYCKNAGRDSVTYQYELYIANATEGMEKAIRVRLYVNGAHTDYAHPRTDGVAGPEPGTAAFLTANTVTRQRVSGFAPGDVTKFTVVIWLEGDDPECLDHLIGGEFRVDMSITVVAHEEGA